MVEEVLRIFKGGVGLISSVGGGVGFFSSMRISNDDSWVFSAGVQLFGRVKSSSHCRQRPMIPSGCLLHNLQSLGSTSVEEVSFSMVPGEGEKYCGFLVLLLGSWRASLVFDVGGWFPLSSRCESPAQ